MECKEIIKKDFNVYLIDSNNNQLNLSNDRDISKYEKNNKVDIIKMVDDFLEEQDNGFLSMITDIEEMVQLYHIDYFILGEGIEVSYDNLAIMYNLKNRNSYVDCALKIFYNKDERFSSKLKYMLDFSQGANGQNFGYSIYRYFTKDEFYIIKNMLEDYFQDEKKGDKTKKVINDCMKNIQRRL